MARHPLIAYHDAEDALFFRWNARTALVQISGWCLTLVPFNGQKPDDPGPKMRAGLSSLLEQDACQRASISFGALSMWANRRTFANALGDPQLVLGALYNREVIRESLQWLYQHRVSADAAVHMRTVLTEAARINGEACSGYPLIMNCHDWTGIVMNCIGDAGDDPLFGEVANG